MIKALVFAIVGFVSYPAIPAIAEFVNIDPLAQEVAIQTWHSMNLKQKQKACKKQNPKRLVKRYHSGLNKPAKRQLKKAYKEILSNC